jgi:hypothetical protein
MPRFFVCVFSVDLQRTLLVNMPTPGSESRKRENPAAITARTLNSALFIYFEIFLFSYYLGVSPERSLAVSQLVFFYLIFFYFH